MFKKFLIAAAVVISTPFAAAAATMGVPDGSYRVVNMEWSGESFTPRSFWLPNLVPGAPGPRSELWKTTSGSFKINGDGSAVLMGSAAQINDMELTFDYLFNFQRRDDALAGYCQYSGTKQPCSDFSGETGYVDPANWDYFDFVGTGSLEGTGALDGAVWSVADRGGVHPPQGGIGADALVLGVLGFSTWINSTLVSGGGETYDTSNGSYTLYANGTTKHGDINLDLESVPLPAAGWMLIAGVAGIGAVSRRKRRKAA